MASKNLKRLAVLLPTVALFSYGLPSQTGALELTAPDYVSRILSALSAGNLFDASSAVSTLRLCGVEAIVTTSGQLSLEQIDKLIEDLRAGNSVALPDLNSEGAFIVKAISQTSVSCEPAATPKSLLDDTFSSPATSV